MQKKNFRRRNVEEVMYSKEVLCAAKMQFAIQKNMLLKNVIWVLCGLYVHNYSWDK